MNRSSEPILELNQKKISWVRVAGHNVAFVDEQWRGNLRESGLQTAEDFFSVVGEALSKPGLRKRYRARLALGKNSFVYLMRYEGDTLAGFWNRWYEDGQRSTPAEREVNVALVLRQQNIAATMPVAYGRSNDAGLNQKSFVVTAAVPGDYNRGSWKLGEYLIAPLGMLRCSGCACSCPSPSSWGSPWLSEAPSPKTTR